MNSHIHIHEGTEARALLEQEGGKAKLELLENLMKGICANSRQRMADVLESSQSEDSDDEMSRYLLKSVTEIAEQGNMFVATRNGKPVGMIGIDRAGHDPNSDREVWKVVRISVLKEAEGFHIGYKLALRALSVIHERHPEADVLMTTEHEGIANAFKRVGVPRISSTKHWYQIIHETRDVSRYKKEMDGDAHVDAYLIPREMLGTFLERPRRQQK